MTEFAPFFDVEETSDTLYTILCHNIVPNRLISELQSCLQSAKNIQNFKKKTMITGRLTSLLKELDTMTEKEESKTPISCIYFLSDKIANIKIKPEWNKLLDEHKIPDLVIKCGPRFEAQYWHDFFLDTQMNHLIIVDNQTYTHNLVNSTKQKLIFKTTSSVFNLSEYIVKNIKPDECLIVHGVSSILRNYNIPEHYRKTSMIFTNKLTIEAIHAHFAELLQAPIHQKLETCYQMIQNPKTINRLLFGSEIQKAVFQRSIKELYCSPANYRKAIKNIPTDYRSSHFTIHEVRSFKPDDVGDQLVKLYGGAIGVTYY